MKPDATHHIPLLTIVGRDRAKAKTTISDVLEIVGERGFDRRHYRDQFDVEQADWVLHREDLLGTDPADWISLGRRFLQRAQSLERLKGRKIFHVFLDCPIALAVGLGASLGTRYLTNLYHWQPPYVQVMDIHDPARLKARAPSPPQYITVQWPERWTSDVLISLQLSAFSPEAFFKAEIAERELALVIIENTYDNALSLEADWFQVVLEVVNVLQQVLNQPGVRRLHLAFSSPVPLAFAIGMALGVQPPVRVYSWFRGQRIYVPVFDLDQIRPLDGTPAESQVLLPPWTRETPDRQRLTRLREMLIAHFDEGELKTLCFDLGESYENLPGEGKANKARELVAYFERRGHIPELTDRVRKSRPNVSWQEGAS